MTDFKNSQTRLNLMRAFAGESQARNRYTFAHGKAKQLKMHVLAEVFKFTADQEKEHAEIFYNHLKELSGQTLTIDGTYPVDIYEDMLSLLKAARHNEFEEYEDVYPSFAQVAKEEGFMKVAADFENIAKIEKIHGTRFEKLAELLEQHELFASSKEEKWLCLNCGHVHTGKEAPKMCPVCAHEQGYFVRIGLAPYTCEGMIDASLTGK